MSSRPSAADLRALLDRSGLLPPEALGEIPPDTDAALLLERLVRDRLLTEFQAQQLERGKCRGFFINGKYKLLEHLGVGGMGMVYLCEHLILQRLVAIKMVHLAADPDSPEESALVARFHREARAVAALDHPNIVRVFDVDRMATGPFMVMEYVDGTNLHALVSRRGVMTAERSAAYVRQAANGLAHAHQAGLIHRDIKPSNILLDRQGVVKLVDLGLARFDRDPARNEGITTRFDANNVIGTVDFMAPEQAFHNSPIDARSDIYSLGCTFYFLLTGRVPFPEGSLPQKMYAHQTQAPEPISQILPSSARATD